jgi:hypothetical protein
MAPPFLTSALDGGEWLDSLPGPLYPRINSHRVRFIGNWMGPEARLGVMEKSLLPLPGIEPRFLDRPSRSLVAIPTDLYHVLS